MKYIIEIKGDETKADFVEKEKNTVVAPGTGKKQKFYISKYENRDKSFNKYAVKVFFDDGCQMENIRAFTIVHNLREVCSEINHIPSELFDNDSSSEYIIMNGFSLYLTTYLPLEDIKKILNEALFVKNVDIMQVADFDDEVRALFTEEEPAYSVVRTDKQRDESLDSNIKDAEEAGKNSKQNLISVNINKLDKLMDVVGEIVIAESMVTRNPDLKGLHLDNFSKAARQLQKLTDELQDIVMSIRMIPVAATFNRMHRIVRDMSKKLNKEVRIVYSGEDTEVDKNIIDHLSDPLIHLVRNSVDHGIEAPEDREAEGKPRVGTIMLEAVNSGSDVVVTIKDDGKGLDREKILQRARENGLIHKPESDMTSREIYNLILLPGFSTKDSITEFSGRGVGMDVVVKNIQTVGGVVSVDSIEGCGTTVVMKIPLTLAIIDGMNICVGKSRYTIPTISIKESFRPQQSNIITDPDGNEGIMVRGQCYPIVRLHRHFHVNTDVQNFEDGIFIMVEYNDKNICIFADELLGQQQVVVKPLPNYIKNIKNIRSLAGCTLLGDGSISLIFDVGGLIETK